MRTLNKKYIEEMKEKYASSPYPLAKWIQFCELMLDKGYQVDLHRAKTTFSKYVHVRKGSDSFKVRFSNHAPNKAKEFEKDCDFFVGMNNFVITTTSDAIVAVDNYFKDK